MSSLVSENTVAFVKGVAAEARRVETPCGDGHMIWHVWGEGPPLALLHGGYGSWTHWICNVIPLSRSFTVAAPDLPGLGESATPPEPHTAEGLASIVVEGLEIVFRGLLGVHIAGFSRPGRGRAAPSRRGTRRVGLGQVTPDGMGVAQLGREGLRPVGAPRREHHCLRAGGVEDSERSGGRAELAPVTIASRARRGGTRRSGPRRSPWPGRVTGRARTAKVAGPYASRRSRRSGAARRRSSRRRRSGSSCAGAASVPSWHRSRRRHVGLSRRRAAPARAATRSPHTSTRTPYSARGALADTPKAATAIPAAIAKSRIDVLSSTAVATGGVAAATRAAPRPTEPARNGAAPPATTTYTLESRTWDATSHTRTVTSTRTRG